MKKLIYTSFLVVATTAFILSGCKKDKTTDTTTTADDTATQTSNASDESNVSSESSKAIDDANIALGAVSTTGRYASGGPTLCDAVIDSSMKSSKVIIINYQGTKFCDEKKRSGQIKLELLNGTKWSSVGATVKATFTNYTVTRLSDGKSITINGTHSIKNRDGGLIGSTATVVHIIRGSMSITFDNGTGTRNWNVARKVTYNSTGSARYVKEEADTTIGGDPVVIWGTTRNNVAFSTVISKAIEVNSVCGWNKPTTGIKIHKGGFKDLTVTFGVDKTGNPIYNGSNCGDLYGFKINWTNAKGESKQAVINY